MGGVFRRIDIFEPHLPSLSVTEASIFRPRMFDVPLFLEENEIAYAYGDKRGLCSPCHHDYMPDVPLHCAFDDFDAVTDLIRVERTPLSSSYTRVRHRFGIAPLSTSYTRVRQRFGSNPGICGLCDRASDLELRLDRVFGAKVGDRKYTWTAEIESPQKKGVDRKYKWTAEIESPVKGGLDRKYKWTVEIKGGDKDCGGLQKEKKDRWTVAIKGKDKGSSISRTCAIEDSPDVCVRCGHGAGKGDKKCSCATRAVKIELPGDHRAVVMRQAYAKRAGAIAKVKGKKKILSPQDAAMAIQMNFRAHLLRRSQALRSLRELAVAKSKLRELRALFNNFSYRRCVARDAEERQRFSERIIVVLLTVDAIEGVDLMVRAAKRLMVDELEGMLNAVDPQPGGKLCLRRKFDLPECGFNKEIAAGVAEVVQMLDQAEKYDNDTFEVCL